ncbi:MAG: hypothetical protein ACLU99_00895 [Alphaproteobacteria bacterium]
MRNGKAETAQAVCQTWTGTAGLEFSAEYLYQKLKNKKVPIKVAILDQEVVVGIGNIYASETLYKAGISPLRRADKITKKNAGRDRRKLP